MSIAALFTIARTWKQPKCSSTDKENVIRKMTEFFKVTVRIK